MIQQSVESVESLEECEVAEVLACEEQGSEQESAEGERGDIDAALDGAYEAGGKAWDGIDNAQEYIDELRGDDSGAVDESSPASESSPDSEKPTDAVRLARLEEWRSKVQRTEDDCRLLNLDVEARKSALKEAKDRFDGKVAELRDLVSRGPDQPQLFDGCGEINNTTVGGSEGDELRQSDFTEGDPAPVSPAAPDESWRTVSLIEAGVPIKIYDLLAEHSTPILTVGDLADFTSGEHNRLTSIKGIGAGKAEKIEAALEKFWASRKAESVEEESATESASDES